MAEVFLPRQPHVGMNLIQDLDPPDSNPLLLVTSSTAGPKPNPPFVFPLQADTKIDTAESSPRRFPNRSRPHQLSLNALPLFEFGAGPSSLPTSTPSPTRSPARRTPPPPPGSGHRRGGSEFIGGDITHGGPILIGTSPTTNESTKSPPPVGTIRRGHAHRRSGAVSQTDLSMLMGRANDHKGGSVPTTPSDPAFHRPQLSALDRSISQPSCVAPREESSTPTPQHIEMEAMPRSQVGFSEVLEYIPRPLSTISSDTSSSMSTIRAGHAVNDSTTSILSANATSPPSLRALRPSGGSINRNSCRSRASTASSISLNIVESDQTSDSPGSETLGRPSTAPERAPSSTEGSLIAPTSSSSDFPILPTVSQPFNLDSASFVRPTHYEGLRQRPVPQGAGATRPRTSPSRSPEPKVIRRQRKVKSWTGLLRKGKQNSDQDVHPAASTNRQSPSPPRSLVSDAEFSLENVTFDEDTTCIIESSAPYAQKSSSRQMKFDPHTQNGSSPKVESEFISPMIDIDVALGTSDPLSDEATAAFQGSKRRLHSSGETGGFSGPGMHYHRRADSAPEMENSDRPRLGFPRLGSNPAMTEAIEEEEEDGDHNLRRGEMPTLGLGVDIVETEPPIVSTKRRDRVRDRHVSQDRPPSSSPTDFDQDVMPVEIVSADEEPRFSVITKSSDESTITPTLSHDALAPRPASAPMDCAIQTPSLVYSTPDTPSALSSADYSKSSFDVAESSRGHTANSSITDRATLSSSRTGEICLRSVDDVPSLTSSSSTMISGHPTRFSSSSNTNASVDRAHSLSAAIKSRARPGTASKRSSLASLSRLVGNSYNKSKLNIEESAPPDSPQKTEKKKSHRLSRMMRFWKSKEKLPSS